MNWQASRWRNTRSRVEQALALGVPDYMLREVIESQRAKFVAELAATVIAARAACDDPSAPRH
jgi:hypothetical protein